MAGQCAIKAMQSSVTLQCRILAFLALCLIFISQNIGVYAFILQTPQSHQIILMMLTAHGAGMVVCGLFMPYLLAGAGGRRFFPPLPLLPALAVLLILSSSISAWQCGLSALGLRAFGVGLLWPLALYAFFLFTPKGSRGLLLGLLIAIGELIWIVLLPTLHLVVSDISTESLVGFMHRLQMVLQCAIGLALVVFCAMKGKEEQGYPEPRGADAAPVTLPLLFAAAMLFYVAFGLISGVAFPKATRAAISENAHIALLLVMPAAGALLDRGVRALLAVLCGLAIIAPAMLFLQNADTREALYIVLFVGRQGVFLATLLLADRLLQSGKRLPLCFALAYIFVPLGSFAGNVVARVLADNTFKATLAIGMVMLFAVLLLRLRGALSGLPVAKVGDAPIPHPDLQLAPGPAYDPGRLAAFGLAYGLSRQEFSVMEMLTKQHSTQDIAKAMQVTESTVRNYIARVLKKTAVPSRAALMALFAVHHSAPPEATEPSAPNSRPPF